MGGCALAAFFLWLPLLWGQHEAKEGEKKKHPAMGDPQAIAAGAKLFLSSCAACHGVNAEGGRGPNLRRRGAWHPLEDEELFRVIHKGIPGADMPAANLPEDQAWQIAAFVRSLTSPAADAPPPGNVQNGKDLFYGKGGCSRCHRILGRGGMLGPDLSNIGATRSLHDLREAILDPDADGFPRYRGVSVTLRDGRTLRGVARNRSNYSIQLQDEDGNLHLVPVKDVKEMVLSAHSPMPADYGRKLSRQELDDLLAFLSRQAVRSAAKEERQ